MQDLHLSEFWKKWDPADITPIEHIQYAHALRIWNALSRMSTSNTLICTYNVQSRNTQTTIQDSMPVPIVMRYDTTVSSL